MSPLEILGLGAAAAVAGVMNALAGGGTLITFPVLLCFGMGPIAANATSTLALFAGTAGSTVGFRRQFAAVRGWLIRFVPVSAVGGWLGGVLLTHTSDRVFARLVPFLILFATLLFLAQGAFRQFSRSEAAAGGAAAPHAVWAAIVFQFCVAVYGGYFGAGIGILMLASLGFLGLADIHEMNALKGILAGLINCVAALWFIFAGLIDWPRAGVMTAGALAGYFAGAHFSQKLSQRAMRQTVTGIGLAISAVMFWRQFGGTLSRARLSALVRRDGLCSPEDMWWIYALLSAFFAALTALLVKLGLKGVDSNLATAIRSVVILVLAWGIVWWQGGQAGLARLNRTSLGFLVVSGLATGLSWLFYFRALQLGEVSRVGPIDKASVGLATLLAILFLGERCTWQVALGTALVIAGAVIVALPPRA